jgi:3-methylcrotonyl-CoA carboxylase alpha subunit
VPGYHGSNQQATYLEQAAADIGYPVLLKAVAGGGGKGMRVVSHADDFAAQLGSAKREAAKAFGDNTMLIEKYLTQPRHIEIQVFCDSKGNSVYLFERDCSIQRRHQKVLEEAPAPGLDEQLRQRMGEAALQAAQAIDYEGAGTVEFLLDSDGSFYFMEMNTRLQVEHPVTEMITDLDLVEWQLRIAAGEALPLRQQDLQIRGHAIEARIYAEDPARDFLPMTGKLSYLRMPTETGHVRVDSGVRQGDQISVYYDPMLAKLVVWDQDRQRAVQRMSTALSQFRIGGVANNIDFLYNLVNCAAFRQARLDTGFIEHHNEEILQGQPAATGTSMALAGLYLVLSRAAQARQSATGAADPWSPWNEANGWRLNEPHLHHFDLVIQEKTLRLTIEQTGSDATRRYLMNHGESSVQASGELVDDHLLADIEGHRLQAHVAEYDGVYHLFAPGCATQFRLASDEPQDQETGSQERQLCAPMNGTIVSLLVDESIDVKKNEPLVLIEAMKMEHTIRAPCDGRVMRFYYQPGDLVDGGAELLEFDADE